MHTGPCARSRSQTSSPSSCCSISLRFTLVEKNPELSAMLPTRSASLSCRHIDSLRSFVVSHPSEWPAPSCRATHMTTRGQPVSDSRVRQAHAHALTDPSSHSSRLYRMYEMLCLEPEGSVLVRWQIRQTAPSAYDRPPRALTPDCFRGRGQLLRTPDVVLRGSVGCVR